MANNISGIGGLRVVTGALASGICHQSSASVFFLLLFWC